MAEGKTSSNEIGATGLSYVAGGAISEEINPKLAGREAITVYKEMSDNDPVVSAIMYSIDMLVRQVQWQVEQGEATEKDVEFLEGCMEDMSHSWSDFISEVMSMLRYGFSFHEIVYKRRQGIQKEGSKVPTSKYKDGKIGWRKLPIRSQDSLDTWDIDEDGALQAFVQKAPPKYETKPIPMTKGLLFRTSSFKNNPEGKSLLRGAYRPWYYKKRIEEIEGTGIERDLAGFPKFGVPAAYLADTATPDEKSFVAAISLIGQNLRRDKQEFLIWPNAFDEAGNQLFTFDLISAAGTRTFDTSAIIGRYDQRIAMTVLADFILLGHEKVGSFALSSDKTDLFAVALGTILDVIQDVLNRFAVPRLWALNGWDPSKAPQFKHGDIEDPDLAALGAYLQSMAGIGMPLFPDEDLEKYLRTIAHLPEKSDETKEAQEQAKAEGQAQPGAPAAGGGQPQEDSDGTLRFTDGPPTGATVGAGANGNGQPPPAA